MILQFYHDDNIIYDNKDILKFYFCDFNANWWCHDALPYNEESYCQSDTNITQI